MQRREFLSLAAAAPAVSQPSAQPLVAVFTKPLQKLGWAELGRAIGRTNLRHADLTVRPEGHVLPERVREDLPRAVEALAGEGVSIAMITTELTSASDSAARPILAEAARFKIPYYKLGYWRYRKDDVEQTLVRVEARCGGLGCTRQGTADTGDLAQPQRRLRPVSPSGIRAKSLADSIPAGSVTTSICRTPSRRAAWAGGTSRCVWLCRGCAWWPRRITSADQIRRAVDPQDLSPWGREWWTSTRRWPCWLKPVSMARFLCT